MNRWINLLPWKVTGYISSLPAEDCRISSTTHIVGVFNPLLQSFPSLRAIGLRTCCVVTLYKGIVAIFVARKRPAVEPHIGIL